VRGGQLAAERGELGGLVGRGQGRLRPFWAAGGGAIVGGGCGFREASIPGELVVGAGEGTLVDVGLALQSQDPLSCKLELVL
jgi:hypothetical protein